MIDTEKKKLKSLVESLRKTLKEEIFKTLYERFLFQIKDKTKRQLNLEAKYELEKLTEYVASLGKDLNDRNSLDAILDDLIRKKSYTFINRLFFLKSQEASGNLKVNGLTGFDKNSEYILFRELCPELCQETDEGWTYFLDILSSPFLETLPGLFADNDILSLIPIPGRAIKEALRKIDNEDYKELWKKESGATHDTLLGWLYQYWNDPDREQVNNKVIGKGVAKGKVEANEISFATQLYTEEYMVEWLVQNSIGTQWMAICRKNQSQSTTGILPVSSAPAHRQDARGTFFWKYYIDSEITEEMITNAPNSIYEIRVIDPACGSGHFLIYVFNFLLYLAELEDESRGIKRSKSERAKLILENCIYGIDIDPRAVQITAASLYQRYSTVGFQPASSEKDRSQDGYGTLLGSRSTLGRINIVSTDIQLWENTNHPETLELRNKFIQILKEEYKLNGGIAEKFWKVLEGAAYMGSLLQPREELDKLLQDAMEKNILFMQDSVVGNGRDRSIHGLLDNLYNRFKQIVAEHDTFEDLGIKNLAEQMSKGARLLEILELKYHVVVANPPYLSQSKVDGELLKLFKNNSSELYESFIYTFQTKLTPSGLMGFLTAHNFMFISKFEELRKYLLSNTVFYKVLHLGPDTFQDVLNALGFVAFININKPAIDFKLKSKFIRLSKYRMNQKEAMSLNPPTKNIYTIEQSKFTEIPGYPLIYWWTEEFREKYKNAEKIGDNVRKGAETGYNERFLRNFYEVSLKDISIIKQESEKIVNLENKWQPHVMGANATSWFEPLVNVINWKNDAYELKSYILTKWPSISKCLRSIDKYFLQGLAFNSIGTGNFLCRIRNYKSIFDVSGSTIFLENSNEALITLSSKISTYVIQSINPTINNPSGDIQKLPIFPVPDWEDYFNRAKTLYDHYFSLKETCIEYCYKGTAGILPVSFEEAQSTVGFQPASSEEVHRQDAYGTLEQAESTVGILPASSERNLPHWREDGAYYFVTFHLNDSLTQKQIKEIDLERKEWIEKHGELDSEEKKQEYYSLFSERINELLDNGMGSCALGDNECAQIVANALKFFDKQRYDLGEWVIMPNHVHVIVRPYPQWTLSSITHSWKSFTAKEINKKLNRTGKFWQEESYDHIIRNEKSLYHIEEYIRKNPEKAGLNSTTILSAANDHSTVGFQPASSEEAHRQDARGTLALELAEFHHFEFLHQAKELALRSEIDKVVYSQFTAETVSAIQEEVGKSVGMYGTVGILPAFSELAETV